MADPVEHLLNRADELERTGRWIEAVQVLQQVMLLGVEHRDEEAIKEGILRTGFAYRSIGGRELALENLELALVVAELADDNVRAARALNGLGTVWHTHGDYRVAEVHYKRAQKFAEASFDRRTAAHVNQNLGALASVRGEVEQALVYYEEAATSYRALGDKNLSGLLNNMGLLEVGRGEVTRGLKLLQEALAVCRQTGDLVTESRVHVNLTEAYLASGELEAARESCDAAFEVVSHLGERGTQSDTLRYYGIIYRRTGKPYLAETHLREAIEVAARHELPLEEAEAYRELALVLRAHDRNREALEALNRAYELFESLQAKHFQAVIEERVKALQRSFLAVVQSWGESIEAKDRYTKGHCQRVAAYASKIAERIGMPAGDLVWFRMGAFLHDVGKTELSGDILNKPGKLTDSERHEVERHTVLGDQILERIPFPWDIRPMVRSHHERWDGRGYPDGLRGSDIPLTARILRIADVFDALTTTRSYRQPLSPEQALHLMQDDHGSFDPELFDVFRDLFPSFRFTAVEAQEAEALSNT